MDSKLIERLRVMVRDHEQGVPIFHGANIGDLLTEAADALSRPIEAVAGDDREGVRADCGAIAKPTEGNCFECNTPLPAPICPACNPPRPTREEVAEELYNYDREHLRRPRSGAAIMPLWTSALPESRELYAERAAAVLALFHPTPTGDA